MNQKITDNNTFPCPLCKQGLPRRTDKKGKPYFVCDDCGTQFFIRRPTGASRLTALMGAPAIKTEALKIPAPIKSEVTKQLDWIDEGADLFDETEALGPPESDGSENVVPIPEWIQQRTAKVRSLLNLK